MQYEKVIGWGLSIYAIMFLLWSGFVTYGFIEGLMPRIVGLIVLVGLMYYAGKSLPVSSWQAAIPYALGWVIVVAALDSLISVPATGWIIFLDWNLWISYAIIFAVPLFAAHEFSEDEKGASVA